MPENAVEKSHEIQRNRAITFVTNVPIRSGCKNSDSGSKELQTSHDEISKDFSPGPRWTGANVGVACFD